MPQNCRMTFLMFPVFVSLNRRLIIPKFLHLFPFPWQRWPHLWWPLPVHPSPWPHCLPRWSKPPSHLSQPHPPPFPWRHTPCPYPWGFLPWWPHCPSRPACLSPIHNHPRPPAVDQWDAASRTSVTFRSQLEPQRVGDSFHQTFYFLSTQISVAAPLLFIHGLGLFWNPIDEILKEYWEEVFKNKKNE